MKAIFGDIEAVFDEEAYQWNSSNDMLKDALNSRLWRERNIQDEKDYSIEFAISVAKKQMPYLDWI